MASVIRKLWGHHPKFLKTKPQKTLFKVLAHLPNQGVGVRVIKTDWFHQGLDQTFYTITRSQINGDFISGKIFGVKTCQGDSQGKEVCIKDAGVARWKLYKSPQEWKQLLDCFKQ